MQKLQKKLKEKINGLIGFKEIQCQSLIKIGEISKRKWIIDSNIKTRLLEIFNILLQHSKKH